MPELINCIESFGIDVNMYFLLDTSASMVGAKIDALNIAMSEGFEIIKRVSECGYTEKFWLNVMKFSTGFEWLVLNNNDLPLNELAWKDISADGLTDMGSALAEMNKKIQATDHPNTTLVKTVVIMICDGSPTDDFSKICNDLLNNSEFMEAERYAILIGDDCDENLLHPVFDHIVHINDTDIISNVKETLADAIDKSIDGWGCKDVIFGEELYKNENVSECPICGFDEVSGNFCAHCGNALKKLDAKVAYNTKSSIRKTYSYSCSCGHEWQETVVEPDFVAFCPKCGNKFAGTYFETIPREWEVW